MTQHIKYSFLFAFLLFLSACGGGGDSAPGSSGSTSTTSVVDPWVGKYALADGNCEQSQYLYVSGSTAKAYFEVNQEFQKASSTTLNLLPYTETYYATNKCSKETSAQVLASITYPGGVLSYLGTKTVTFFDHKTSTGGSQAEAVKWATTSNPSGFSATNAGVSGNIALNNSSLDLSGLGMGNQKSVTVIFSGNGITYKAGNSTMGSNVIINGKTINQLVRFDSTVVPSVLYKSPNSSNVFGATDNPSLNAINYDTNGYANYLDTSPILTKQ